MSARLAWNGYGKAAVRLVKVDRGPQDALHDLTVEVQLQGDFLATHASGDNACVLPTDTMKNSVYVLAHQGPVDPLEAFGERLGKHFLEACPSASQAVISLLRHQWDRLSTGAAASGHDFVRGSGERRLAVVTVTREGTSVEAGLEGLGLLKTTHSGFAGFLRDAHTTLKETDDRIFATEVTAQWAYIRPPEDYGSAWTRIRTALIQTFVGRRSDSAQQTLYAMGEAALAACAAVSEIRLVLPNQHHLLVDLSPFGLQNINAVYQATREPYGRIEAVIARS